MRKLLKGILERIVSHYGYNLLRIGQVEPAFLSDLTPAEHETIQAVQSRTMLMPHNLAMLCRCIEYITEAQITGAIVECGVWRGGAVMSMLRTLIKCADKGRDVYLYDTFEGMPKPSERDISWQGISATELHSMRGGTDCGSNWAFATIDDVREGVSAVGYPSERINYVRGLVEETVPRIMPDQIALLRLDTDWYSSTKHELIHMFPRLSPGGVLVIDDYGTWRGAREAVDEYFSNSRPPVLLVRSDAAVRYGVKVS